MAVMDIGVEVCFGEEAAGEIVLAVDFKWRAGSPAYFSPVYGGHPGDPPELEIETIYWPCQRWDKEKRSYILDHIKMPCSGLPQNVAEAIELYILEHYDDSHDCDCAANQ